MTNLLRVNKALKNYARGNEGKSQGRKTYDPCQAMLAKTRNKGQWAGEKNAEANKKMDPGLMSNLP